MKLQNEFQPIRDWAEERGIYEKANINKQFLKLMEEVGELANAILKDEKLEIDDAIGDCVVVLTNLAHFNQCDIEDCINAAWAEIKDRKGSMKNGSFIKE